MLIKEQAVPEERTPGRPVLFISSCRWERIFYRKLSLIRTLNEETLSPQPIE